MNSERGFADRAENVLACDLPGLGKTHCACVIGHELIDRGQSVTFRPARQIVQQLLTERRDLELEREFRGLDRFDVVILDDSGDVQQDRQEMDVLLTVLAERFEGRSLVITSSLAFSQWGQIFKDAVTTAGAIDRLVHHATILELAGESYRAQAAKRRRSQAVAAHADE